MPRLLTALLCALLLSGPTRETGALPTGAQGPVWVAHDLMVKSARFGYVDPQTGKLVQSGVVDTSKHKAFGWEIELDGTRRSVRFREEFVLPAPAATWGVGPETKVAADRASAVTESLVALGADMTVRHIWMHSPGDPRGPHRISVAIEGVQAAEFRFTLTPSAPPKTTPSIPPVIIR